MLSKPFWREVGHTMSPDKRKDEAGQHNEEKPGVHQSDLFVGVAKTKPCIKIAHSVPRVIQNPKRDSKNPFSLFPATMVLVLSPKGRK